MFELSDFFFVDELPLGGTGMLCLPVTGLLTKFGNIGFGMVTGNQHGALYTPKSDPCPEADWKKCKLVNRKCLDGVY